MSPVRLTACSLLLFVCSVAAAQDPVLHEYIPAVEANEGKRALGVSGAHEPPPLEAASNTEGEDESSTSSDEPSTGTGGGAGPQSENFRPDRLTSLEGNLDYYEAFNPSIAPFKRVMSLDAVRLDVDGKTPVLGIVDVRRRLVAIEKPDAPPPDARPRDRFTAELMVDFASGPAQRLPSVSPESRILTVRTEPAIRVRIERDPADNYFIRALGVVPEQPVRVSFLTDAPRAYFGTTLTRSPLRQLPGSPPRLEASIARRALRFAAQLGLTPKSDVRSAIETLTDHFRGFVESTVPPPNTGDLYLDLVRARKGLCRHRAYGFVVTAQALGIAARFVQNEAHSWVEVPLPDTGWLRIDLGGASHGLTAHNARDRPSYLPAQPDTLPRPDAYRQSYAQAAPSTRAARPDAADVAGRWLREDAVSTSASANNIRPESTAAANPGVNAGKKPIHMLLDDQRMSALRGGKLVLTGRVLDDAQRGVAELRVEIWITRQQRRERMLLGVQVTDSDGYFRSAFGVPPDLAVGDYQLLVLSQGDAQHLAAAAD